MELPSLNKQCNETDCKQLDFLPLQCKCGKIFCSHHFNRHLETCEESRYLSKEDLKKIEGVFICSYSDCKERSIIPLICERCKKHFCIKHRHLQECKEKDPTTLAAEKEKYAAPVRQFNEAKASIDKQLNSKLFEAKKKEKSRDMVQKVQLMRIKNKATGLKSISVTDRLYFNVIHPLKDTEKNAPIFVSKQWTLGRAIDAVAEELKLVNNNNKSNEKKLRLFKKDDKEIVSNIMSVGLATLLEDNKIVNGDDLIIDYVDNECVKLS